MHGLFIYSIFSKQDLQSDNKLVLLIDLSQFIQFKLFGYKYDSISSFKNIRNHLL
jgi:hypothetical protein